MTEKQSRNTVIPAAVSIIIPVFRESENISRHIRSLQEQSGSIPTEILVCDGSPDRDTLNALTDPSVIQIPCRKGRGIQMHTGAIAARGGILLFLHADTMLPEDGVEKIAGVFRNADINAGAFDLAIDSPRPVFRIIEKTASLRSRLTRIPYGDQAVFIRREVYFQLGGFRDIPIMEDVDLLRRVRRRSLKIAILRDRVRTSPRRWEQEGLLYGTLRNWVLISLYLMGVKPEKLSAYYR